MTREAFTLAWLRASYPEMAWTEPAPRGDGYDCRVCVASFGKKGEAPRFADIKTAREHIAKEHPE